MADGRSLGVIAGEIRRDWKNVNPAAKSYLDPMASLRSVEDKYYDVDGEYMVRYFLANAATWRGPTARRIKAELHRLLGE